MHITISQLKLIIYFEKNIKLFYFLFGCVNKFGRTTHNIEITKRVKKLIV